jgi:hypothetical protein
VTLADKSKPIRELYEIWPSLEYPIWYSQGKNQVVSHSSLEEAERFVAEAKKNADDDGK